MRARTDKELQLHGASLALCSRRALLSGALAACFGACIGITGCVDQHPYQNSAGDKGSESRIVVTSPATAEILDKLDLDVVGAPTTARGLPERYKNVEKIGTAMAPDLEAIKALDPDVVISPNSLISDLRPKYAAAALPCIFIDLKSVSGLFDSVEYLGKRFNRTELADELISQHEEFMKAYRLDTSQKNAQAPKVLILMGVPGSYVVATPKSYVGSLVELAGATNVYEDGEQDFVNVNTEDMLARDPDIILRTAHALPEQVMSMFAQEFSQNDIWKHFRAVQEQRVFDLDSSKFGMSAEFNYPQALKDLQSVLFG